MDKAAFLKVSGKHIANGRGETVVLRGTCLGGRLNMENFMTARGTGSCGRSRSKRRASAPTAGATPTSGSDTSSVRLRS